MQINTGQYYTPPQLLVRFLNTINTNSFLPSQVNSRVKALKRQLDEAEEEISRERAQKRKTQRELEDTLQDNESKEREITNLKNKIRSV